METPPSPETRDERPRRIAQLNDLLRWTFLGKVMTTVGIQSLDGPLYEQTLALVQGFTAFTPDNDPYGEHDFGSVTLTDGTKVFWKIDYYDKAMEFGSEDPADAAKTTRVLTIMLAEEY